MEEAVWPGSVFAAHQEALNLELVKLEGKGRNPSSVAGSAAHPGWVKLGSASHSVSQRDDEFSERSDAVLWLTSTSPLQPKRLQNTSLYDKNFLQMLKL